jgi:hypothetical protein
MKDGDEMPPITGMEKAPGKIQFSILLDFYVLEIIGKPYGKKRYLF